MKNKNSFARYRLIDNRMTMKQKPAPSLQELVDFVCEKMETSISSRAIQKDIYNMRYDADLGFNAPIEYSAEQKGYIYTDPSFSISKIPVSEEDLQGLEIAIGILEQFKNIPAIKLFEDAINKIASSVKLSREQNSEGGILLLDRPKRYQGIEFLNDIVDAIRGKHVLKVYYKPFSKPEPKKHTVHPYFIKEYNGRMYLIGKDIHPTKESKFLTYSLDRMTDVIKMNQTFQEEHLDRENYFKSAIGISLTGSQPEKVQLQFTPDQANYIKSQPIHHSQTIIKENENEFSIALDLVINYELKALLLSFGNKVKIVKPLALADEIKNILKETIQQYK